MKHLGISGGGTKITGLFGAAEALLRDQQYQPDLISGISAGAILSLPLAMGKWEATHAILDNLKTEDFFNKPAFNDRGKLTLGAISRAISGRHYLGQQRALNDRVREVISPEDFAQYQLNDKQPICLVGSVDRITGTRYYFNLKEVDYETMIKAIAASAAIPIFTEGIFLDWQGKSLHLYDGGIRDHCPTGWVLTDSPFAERITETVSLYSRPQDYVLKNKTQDPGNVLSVLQDYVDISNVEVSKMDEQLEDLICKKRNIPQRKYFLPSIMQSVYDTDPVRLRQLYEAGRQVVLDTST